MSETLVSELAMVRPEQKRILMLAHDPGGANAVAAVAAELQRRGLAVLLYGHGPALKRYPLLGLQGLPLPGFARESGIDGMTKLLRREAPEMVISGTSGDDFHERFLWRAAQRLAIPSVALLDQWINFGLRFSPYGLAGRDEYLAGPEHPYQPDYVVAMDDEARRELIRDGIAGERVFVGGQPYFDILASRRASYSPPMVARLRSRLGIAEGEKVVAYVSESIRQDYPVAPGQQPYWGYDEISIFRELVSGLLPLLQDGIRIRLIIKQHPLERDNGYINLAPLLESNHSGLKIDTVQEMDPHDLIMASDLVCGMSSMLLLEALIMDKPALSVQIGLSRENPLILESRGIMKSIQHREELPKALEKALLDEDAGAESASAWHYRPGAAATICEFVEGLLCRN